MKIEEQRENINKLKTFGEMVAYLRKKKDLLQDRLAIDLGVGGSTISRIEASDIPISVELGTSLIEALTEDKQIKTRMQKALEDAISKEHHRPYKKSGKLLGELIKSRNITHLFVAQQLSITKSAPGKWIQGFSMPGPVQLKALLRLLRNAGVSTDNIANYQAARWKDFIMYASEFSDMSADQKRELLAFIGNL